MHALVSSVILLILLIGETSRVYCAAVHEGGQEGGVLEDSAAAGAAPCHSGYNFHYDLNCLRRRLAARSSLGDHAAMVMSEGELADNTQDYNTEEDMTTRSEDKKGDVEEAAEQEYQYKKWGRRSQTLPTKTFF